MPPFPDAEFFVFAQAQFPEAALLFRKQRLLVTTDSIQYWADWRYTSRFTRGVLRDQARPMLRAAMAKTFAGVSAD